jgi:integrase
MRLFPGTTKSDKGRSVVLTTELYNLLSEVCKGKQGEDYVLTRADGRHVVDFRKAWRGLVKAAGMPGLLLHDFRRAAIRNMMRGGISKTVAKKISGHATDSVFDRYDITDEQDLIDAAQKMEARTNGHKLGTLVHVGN